MYVENVNAKLRLNMKKKNVTCVEIGLMAVDAIALYLI